MSLAGTVRPRPVVLLYGLCMNGAQWWRDLTGLGAALTRLGHSHLTLTYNSGLANAESGW